MFDENIMDLINKLLVILQEVRCLLDEENDSDFVENPGITQE